MLLANASLRHRLPTWIGVLLVASIATFGAIAFRAVRRSDVEGTWSRMHTVADRLAQVARVATAARVRRMQEVAADSAVVDVLGDARRLEAARRVLARLGPDTGVTVATLVQDRDGKTVVALDREVKPIRAERPDSASSSPFVVRGDSLLYEHSVPIRRNGAVIGYLVQVRSTRASPNATRIVADLMGGDARVYLGNADGSLWTDLDKPIPPPPTLGKRIRYQRDGATYLLSVERIPNMPLVFGIEYPEASVLAPSRALLQRFVLIGLVTIGAGMAIGWVVTRRITTPLARLTDAAEAIAAGTPVPAVREGDEVRRLSGAFRAMESRVRDAHDNLEQQVADRTAALERAQDALVRKERLAVLGQLASSVGHELRNPLGVINNSAYFIRASLKDPPPKVLDHLTILTDQVKLAEKIIADILDFTRVRTPELAEVPVAELVGNAVKRVAVPSGIRIQADLERDLPTIAVDRVQLGQVLHNLLTNAVQAMDGPGGVLRVRALRTDGSVRIEVKDGGPGILPENLDRIFEALFTTKSRGFGLGLSISRLLVQAHGGTLSAHNAPEGGAVFVIELPAAVVSA